ncbi:MAG: hypothetical protein GY856_06470, partial [bacterium]|nr:hypothetical protein [bacterium]
MQSLARLRQTFGREKALAGSTVLLNMHLTPETLALGRVLRAGGARLIFLPSNRNPAPPEIVREAEDDGRVLAGAQELAAVDWRATAPCLVVEGNGRIFRELHRPEDSGLPVGEGIVAISEHTSGGGRMVDRFDGDRLRVPVVAVYRDRLKTRLETGLGTSQTVVAALIRGLRRPVAGRRTVVIGFGHVGRGVATSLRTLGARLLVVDVRGEALLEARLAGFAV